MPGGRSVLIALKHDDSRELYAEYLQRLGFEVRSVRDGEAALRLTATADIVVTGLLLPRLDGPALIRSIRSTKSAHRKTIIVVAAAVFPSDRVQAEAAGCDAFLPMPCSPEDLTREIQNLDRR